MGEDRERMRERERERYKRDVGWVGGCKNWTGRNERWRGGTQRLKRLPVTSRLRDDANRVLSFSLVCLGTTSDRRSDRPSTVDRCGNEMADRAIQATKVTLIVSKR